MKKNKSPLPVIDSEKELAVQREEKAKLAVELTISDKALAFQIKKSEKRAEELFLANKELAFQNKEKEKLAQELTIANNDLRKAEEKIRKTNRLYAFSSKVNQQIVRVKDGTTLFENFFRLALELGKFKMAWIGMFDNELKKITLAGQGGISEEDVKLFTDIPNQVNGPQDHVLRTGTYYVCNDMANDFELQNWKTLAEKHGILSCIALPIRESGNIIGTFNLYAGELNFFDKEEIELLEEITNDISFALDILEKAKRQKVTEELIFKNENRFRALIEKGTEMKTLSNLEGEMLYCSPSITKMLGYLPEELLSTSAFNLIHPDDIPAYSEKRNAISDVPGTSFTTQNRFLHKNGNWIWFEGTLTNMLDEPGVNAMVSNFTDVSEKRITDKQQEFERNNLDALINNTSDLMWSVDKNFKLITSNQPFDEIVRLMSGKTIAKGDDILAAGFPTEQLSRYKLFYERAFADETFTEVEHVEIPVEYWTEISYNPIRKGDEVIGTACHSRDITRRKKAEEEREKMITDMIQRNRDLEQFAFIISHNLRAPTANIIGLVDNLQNEVISEKERKSFLQPLSSSALRLDTIIKDIGTILQVKREVDEKKELISFTKLVNDIFISIGSLIDKHRVRIKTEFSQADEFYSLKGYMHSIFYNLITNSIKYKKSGEDPLIEISSAKVNGKTVLVFKDNGLGIDLKTKGDKIFGLYHRFHSHVEGKGMGLFMVKTQVESLGGSISITSEVNKGTTFKIEFKD